MAGDTLSAADRVGVSGIGSWPGQDIREALRTVRDLLGDLPPDVAGLPYLPELPSRGPGADMIGRAAGLLVDLQVDLQPQGWRLVDRPGLDAERTTGLWRQDLDELAEAYDGWSGPLKLQVTGPWTLAAGVWLPRGDRVLSDAGASRDLADSLAEGIRAHLGHVRRLVPGAELVLQLDEPSLPTVLLGRVPSESGYRVLPAPEADRAEATLRSLLETARHAGARSTVLHCCGDRPPVDLLRRTGADAVGLDLALLGSFDWDRVAELVEAGTRLWAGVLPTSGRPPAYERVVERLGTRWHELGLPPQSLTSVTVTPACGLGGAGPQQARDITLRSVDVARDLAEAAAG